MSEEDEVSFSDREIVLELFPATNKRLIPKEKRYRLVEIGDGKLELTHTDKQQSAVLQPIERAGKSSTQVSCDLCHHSAPRKHMQIYRVGIMDTQNKKQHYYYVSLCSNRQGCEERRIMHEPIAILERLFGASI